VNTQKRLYRSTEERMFAGVCGGIAEYLDVDPTLVRLFFVALTLLSGGQGLLIYIVLMLVVPEQPKEQQKFTPEENSDDGEREGRKSPPFFFPSENSLVLCGLFLRVRQLITEF
jgi:phage shock protein C